MQTDVFVAGRQSPKVGKYARNVNAAGIKFTTFDYDSTEFEVVGNIYDNKLEDFNNVTC